MKAIAIKKTIRILFISSLIYLLSPISLLAQTATEQDSVEEKITGTIFLKVKAYADKLVLRWGIDNSALWLVSNEVGIGIDRIILDEQNKPLLNSWTRINTIPIKPYSEEIFRQKVLADTSNHALLIAAEALFGSPSIASPSVEDQEGLENASLEFENKYTLAMLAADMDPLAADALGMRYSDAIEVNGNYKYAYRVYVDTLLPEIFEIDTAFYLLPGGMKDEIYSPRNVKTVGKDGAIHIQIPNDRFYNTFSSYNVERSEDGKHFARLNNIPIVFNQLEDAEHFIYIDSVENYRKYYYRVNGVDAFADTSYYAPTMSSIAKQQTAPPSGFLTAVVEQGKKTHLSWTQDLYEDRPIAGFIVRKGVQMDQLDDYLTTALLPANQREFVDEKPNLVEGAYYQVLAVDTAGNYSGTNVQYVFAYDSIPPLSPSGLRGVADTTGKVTLSWNLNDSDNIQGYRVFMSNQKNGSFSPITSDFVRDTVFIDSLDRSVLNKEIYYRIVAVDGNSNHSDFSEIVTVLRPKMVMTPAPVIENYQVSQGKVSFSWVLPPAKDSKKTEVLRRLANDTTWITLAQVPLTTLNHTDSTVFSSQTYEYAVRVIDENNKASEISFPLQVFVYSTENNAPQNLIVKVENEQSILSWTVPEKGEVDYYIIYKEENNNLVQYDSVDGNQNSYSDRNFGKKYGLKAVFKNQIMSIMLSSQ
ncbi:fibronectin type III domain-containing protein [Sphingobacterium hungaricum]